jgi:hypothetical protein
MNDLQVQYSRIIHTLLNIDGIDYTNGDLGYGLSNYIAKFSLAKETYKISNEAYRVLSDRLPPFNNQLHRGAKKGMDFTYEHAIPVNIIRSKLIALPNKTIEQVQEILIASDYVTIITKRENAELSFYGLKQRFPYETIWNQNINTFTRYQTIGITLNNNEITMQGAIIR